MVAMEHITPQVFSSKDAKLASFRVNQLLSNLSKKSHIQMSTPSSVETSKGSKAKNLLLANHA